MKHIGLMASLIILGASLAGCTAAPDRVLYRRYAGNNYCHMKVHLDYGPDRKQSLAEYFNGRSIPPQVLAIRGHNALCLKTGRKFKLENDDQVLLVPTSSSNPIPHDE